MCIEDILRCSNCLRECKRRRIETLHIYNGRLPDGTVGITYDDLTSSLPPTAPPTVVPTIPNGAEATCAILDHSSEMFSNTLLHLVAHNEHEVPARLL